MYEFDRTIGKMLAEVKNCSFLDADDYHSQYNKGIVLLVNQFITLVLKFILFIIILEFGVMQHRKDAERDSFIRRRPDTMA